MQYEFEGKRPDVHSSAFIAPSADVIGQVRIAAGASVWYRAVLRGDFNLINIGEDCNIQDGTIIHTEASHPVTLGKGVSVGHGAIVHGCTVGEYSLVGMGSTVMNGVTLGKHCVVAAGSLVTEGKSYPDGVMLMGSPAKVVREIPEELYEALKGGAAEYAALAKRHTDLKSF